MKKTFGWDYPAGVTDAMIDALCGPEEPEDHHRHCDKRTNENAVCECAELDMIDRESAAEELWDRRREEGLP